ncbi:hypothetical protein V9T40_011233 [Parthenolecanium corni]|uniref:Erythromycin biosynthesis protein CIII-like C-terminal domain-containing protein n=1 Tax=Parthenolecanium corni TaxID=536013 RepID=A0AAN9TIA4_9HEMI
MNHAHCGYKASYTPNPAFLSLSNCTVLRTGLEPQPLQQQHPYAPPLPPPLADARARCQNGRSHFNFHEAMMKSLLAAGHQVTAVAPMSSKFSHENYTIINYINRVDDNEHPWAFAARQKLTSISLFLPGLNELRSNCHHILKLEEQINVTGNFDIMFVEMLPLFQCFLPLAKKSGIPVIGTMSLCSFMGPDLILGNPRNPSILPAMSSVVHTEMSFYERIENVIEEVKMKVFYFIEKQFKEKLFKELSSNQDLFNYAISLLFVNNHESILPTAQMPNTINIGGIQVKSALLQPLPEPLKIFIEGAENGVILFSLGSVTTTDSIEPEVLTALIRTFANITQRVIWKFSGQIDGLSKNVLLMDWIPQKEILAHENVKAFISHVGISSMYEAIYFGKPMIMMPVFCDQPGNAGLLMSLGVGKYLNFVKVTETELSEALNEVVNNSTYRENMKKLSHIFKDEPISPSEKVLFWTEYVLKHNGTTHLSSLAVDMPIYQYLLLDVTGNFDIMFVEMMPLFQCFLPLAKKSKIPVIGTMTMLSFMGPDLHLGNPRNPSILPAMSSVVHTKMSFYERIENIVEEMKMKIFYAYCEYIKKQYKVKLFNELFSDQDLFDYGVSLLFINNHESILPTAQMTNTINIGGINIKSAQLQPLPEPLKIFIEGAENGVILFSLGSVTTADSIEPEVLAALIRTFAKIPERVLWKFSGKIDGLSENVLLVDWLPQKEILAHENVKAFISHVGIASMYEAIYFGKPMILMPVCADQPGNAGLLMSLGVGEYLNFVKVTETELLEALNEVVNGSK